MIEVPFLRPRLPEAAQIAPLLARIDESRRYSNFGPLNTEFEQRAVRRFFAGQGAATTVCNATLGLMLAIRAVQRPRARYAVMPSFTFAATPLAAQWCGLEPWFVDIDPHDWCADPSAVMHAVEQLGDEVAVVVTYATFGAHLNLAPYDDLMARGIPVVVDAAPCLGTHRDEHAFAANFSGPVVFSLHATKAFAIGEGGLVYSGNSACIDRVRRLSNYGFDASRSSDDLGLNAKLSEHAAAVALCTLDTFDARMQARLALYRRYLERFESTKLFARDWHVQRLDAQVAHQFMPVLVPQTMTGADVVQRLAERGIEARSYFSPACHEQPQFASCGHDGLTHTRKVASRILSLPLWEDMNDAIVDRVVDALTTLA
ncbi:MAG TPA: DegT/DnrJ/EryC1/StrS family aminotransferase [Burkholderiaceae bacterium]|nr:DegT/DnrJ/EryC1/StrS family aminotransferase [Burkholderiaceae bacterium]